MRTPENLQNRNTIKGKRAHRQTVMQPPARHSNAEPAGYGLVNWPYSKMLSFKNEQITDSKDHLY